MSTNFSSKISDTPAPPYYAVIFTSLRTEGDNGYAETAKRMEELSSQYPGFLGIESVRNELGITVSYWSSLEAIQNWKQNTTSRLHFDFSARINFTGTTKYPNQKPYIWFRLISFPMLTSFNCYRIYF